MMRLYANIIRMKYAARMAYRADFFMSVIAFGLFQIVGPLMILVLYSAGLSIEGWSMNQMFLLMGLLASARGLSYMAGFGIFWETQQTVRAGTFDKYLTKPVQPFMLLTMNSFDEEDVGQFLAGIAITIYALAMNTVPLAKLWIVPVAIFAGFLVMFSLAVLFSAVTIIFVNSSRLHEFVIMIGILGSYPKTIYSRSVATLTGVIIPIAVAGYYPAAYLLGIPFEGFGIALLGTVVLTIGSIAVWHIILKSYRSAGG